MNSDDCD
jgi:hypothetical protein